MHNKRESEMAIIYLVHYGSGQRYLTTKGKFSMCFRPTECVWIVPGTFTDD